MRRLMRKPRRDRRNTKKAIVIEDVGIHGEGCRRSPPQAATGVLGCRKSCRINDPTPELNMESFGEDEEDLIIKLHALLGNRWSLIAGRLPGRSDNEVEEYWNCELKRKLISMGIDPNNHRIHHTLPRRKNRIPETSKSDDSNTCATSAALKYHGQNKTHLSNGGSANIELSGTSHRVV